MRNQSFITVLFFFSMLFPVYGQQESVMAYAALEEAPFQINERASVDKAAPVQLAGKAITAEMKVLNAYEAYKHELEKVRSGDTASQAALEKSLNEFADRIDELELQRERNKRKDDA